MVPNSGAIRVNSIVNLECPLINIYGDQVMEYNCLTPIFQQLLECTTSFLNLLQEEPYTLFLYTKTRKINGMKISKSPHAVTARPK